MLWELKGKSVVIILDWWPLRTMFGLYLGIVTEIGVRCVQLRFSGKGSLRAPALLLTWSWKLSLLELDELAWIVT